MDPTFFASSNKNLSQIDTSNLEKSEQNINQSTLNFGDPLLTSTPVRNNEVRTLFVSGLPQYASQLHLYHIFAHLKGYESCLLKEGSVLGKIVTPVGFVTFSSREKADDARKRLKGFKFDPSHPVQLRIEFAKSNSRKSTIPSNQTQPLVYLTTPDNYLLPVCPSTLMPPISPYWTTPPTNQPPPTFSYPSFIGGSFHDVSQMVSSAFTTIPNILTIFPNNTINNSINIENKTNNYTTNSNYQIIDSGYSSLHKSYNMMLQPQPQIQPQQHQPITQFYQKHPQTQIQPDQQPQQHQQTQQPQHQQLQQQQNVKITTLIAHDLTKFKKEQNLKEILSRQEGFWNVRWYLEETDTAIAFIDFQDYDTATKAMNFLRESYANSNLKINYACESVKKIHSNLTDDLN